MKTRFPARPVAIALGATLLVWGVGLSASTTWSPEGQVSTINPYCRVGTPALTCMQPNIGGTLEELIVQECTWLGPVVAIGDPSHPLPPLGVSRMYCNGDTWQETVNGLMQESARIVIVVDSSAAIGPDSLLTTGGRNIGPIR